MRVPALTLACCLILPLRRPRSSVNRHHHCLKTASACACLLQNSLIQAFTLGWKVPSPSSHNGKRLRLPAAKVSHPSVHAWVEIAITVAPERQAPALSYRQALLLKRSRLGRNCHHHRPRTTSACAHLPLNSLTQAFTLGGKLPSPSPQNGKHLRSPAA